VADQRCRVTVVGDSRRVDLAVPAAAPIAEYVTMLADLCGPADDDTFPAVWSLAVPGRAPFPVTSSLDAAGVLDGQVLYLRDVASGEADEPIALDFEEAVEQAAEPFERWSWTQGTSAVTTLSLGGCWLVATLVTLAVAGVPQGSRGMLAALALISAIFSSGLVATARRRQWPLPPALQLGLALSALPELAVAARFIVASTAGPATVVLAASVGLLIGSLFCLAALPSTVTMLAPAAALAELGVAILVSALRADGTESAALVVVLTLALISIAPQAIGALVASSLFAARDDGPDGEVASDQIKQAWWLLAAVNVVLAVASALALVVLADSSNALALALAGCGSVAMVLRAGTRRYLSEIVPALTAGGAGVLALLLESPRWLDGAAWSGAVAATVVGLAVMLTGLARSFGGQPRRWQRFLGPVGVLVGVASVPLMLGVFGLFGHLETLGHHL